MFAYRSHQFCCITWAVNELVRSGVGRGGWRGGGGGESLGASQTSNAGLRYNSNSISFNLSCTSACRAQMYTTLPVRLLITKCLQSKLGAHLRPEVLKHTHSSVS